MNRTSLEAYQQKLNVLEYELQTELSDVQMAIDFAEIEAAAAATVGTRRQRVVDAIGGFSQRRNPGDVERRDRLTTQLGALHAYQTWVAEQIAALPS